MFFPFVRALLFCLSLYSISLLPILLKLVSRHFSLCVAEGFTPCLNFKLVFIYNICAVQIFQLFLDEVNTSSCVGLFKEIIIDRTFDGKVSGQLCFPPLSLEYSFSLSSAHPRQCIHCSSMQPSPWQQPCLP